MKSKIESGYFKLKIHDVNGDVTHFVDRTELASLKRQIEEYYAARNPTLTWSGYGKILKAEGILRDTRAIRIIRLTTGIFVDDFIDKYPDINWGMVKNSGGRTVKEVGLIYNYVKYT